MKMAIRHVGRRVESQVHALTASQQSKQPSRAEQHHLPAPALDHRRVTNELESVAEALFRVEEQRLTSKVIAVPERAIDAMAF